MSEAVPTKNRWSQAKLEIVIAISITVAAAFLHILFLTNAGGLWRDEAGGFHLATLPSLSEVWQELTHDSFPALHPLLLRGWTGLGLGNSDFALRCFGLLVGLSLLAAVWLNARTLGFRTPLITLSLLACNLSIIQWGDSLRAYGLGCVLMVLCVGRVWDYMMHPTPARFAIASLVAVLCVQSLYQCAFLIAATCIAASLICLRRSRNTPALMTLMIGAPAALSLLPYLKPLKLSQQWWIVEKTGFNPWMSWHTLSTALDTPPFIGSVIWIGVFLIAAILGFALFEKRVSRREYLSCDLPLFGAIAATGGLIGYFIFVVNAGLPTQPWYWLLLLTFLAVCIEAILAKRLERAPKQVLFSVAVIACASFASTLSQIKSRLTTMDQVAARLKSEVQLDDLIVVYPWYAGVSFNHHYRNGTNWTTVPELSDHRFHRYDLLKEKLQETEPLRAVKERIQRTLNSGGNVWLVGGLPEAEPGEAQIPTLPPAPDAPSGWYDEPYNHVWGRQLGYFLQLKASKAEKISIEGQFRYTRYEQIPVTKFTGAASSPFTR